MQASSEISMTAVVSLVLGGVAAVVLALVVALGGYGKSGGKRPAVATSAQSARPVAPDVSGELPIEYLLDSSEPAPLPGK